MTTNTHKEQHAIAARIGFYGKRLWWIDTFKINPLLGTYKFWIDGRNEMREGERIYWNVPSVAGPSYAFALRVVF